MATTPPPEGRSGAGHIRLPAPTRRVRPVTRRVPTTAFGRHAASDAAVVSAVAWRPSRPGDGTDVAPAAGQEPQHARIADPNHVDPPLSRFRFRCHRLARPSGRAALPRRRLLRVASGPGSDAAPLGAVAPVRTDGASWRRARCRRRDRARARRVDGRLTMAVPSSFSALASTAPLLTSPRAAARPLLGERRPTVLYVAPAPRQLSLFEPLRSGSAKGSPG